MYKLIKYTLPPVKNTTGFTNLTTSTAFTSDDVEILHQQHVITNLTFKEYETLYDSIFPVSGKIEFWYVVKLLGLWSSDKKRQLLSVERSDKK